LIIDAPQRLLSPPETFFLDVPCALERAWYFAQCKFIDALTHPGTRRIFRCCNIAVMAAAVLYPEVTIRRHGKHYFRETALEPGFLVPEFVASVDAQSTGNACNDCQPYEGPPGEFLRACPIGGANECDEVKRDDYVGKNSIVAITIEL